MQFVTLHLCGHSVWTLLTIFPWSSKDCRRQHLIIAATAQDLNEGVGGLKEGILTSV